MFTQVYPNSLCIIRCLHSESAIISEIVVTPMNLQIYGCRPVLTSFMTSYIGSMYLSESCTNSASWCSAACMDKHPSTCRISANRSPVSRPGNISAPPADDNWSDRLSTYGRRAFAVAGPSVWNSLPDNLRDPAVCSDSFRRSLKTFLFATY